MGGGRRGRGGRRVKPHRPPRVCRHDRNLVRSAERQMRIDEDEESGEGFGEGEGGGEESPGVRVCVEDDG